MCDAAKRKKIIGQADAACNFLKHGYSHHTEVDKDTAQDASRALVGISKPRSNVDGDRSVSGKCQPTITATVREEE